MEYIFKKDEIKQLIDTIQTIKPDTSKSDIEWITGLLEGTIDPETLDMEKSNEMIDYLQDTIDEIEMDDNYSEDIFYGIQWIINELPMESQLIPDDQL